MTDRARMQRALELAQEGSWTCTPNPMVGCVVVSADGTVFEGRHMLAGGPHAEVGALGKAGAKAKGSAMYVNLEPCAHHGRTPPCVDRIIAAGVREVFVAMTDPDPRNDGKGMAALRKAGVKCQAGLLEDEAAWLNRGFVSRVTRKRPWLRLKTASSMDGRISLPGGGWITGAQSRKLVHRMRAESCAIMTASGTALADDPRLTARGVDARRQPLRFLVDSNARCPARLRLFDGKAVWVTATEPKRKAGKNVEVLCLPGKDGKVDLGRLLKEMATRWQINHLMVEAGSGLAGALLRQGLVDEVAAFIAPNYLGAGMSVADFQGARNKRQTANFQIKKMDVVGDDALLTMVKK